MVKQWIDFSTSLTLEYHVRYRSMMATQPHLPEISDEYIILFLHACYYSQDKTKSAIENYFSIRSSNPAIFSDRDAYSARVQNLLSLG
ncbi:unnamed protein product [Acanthoscelides obtectus]|uniref:Uncharacterized protein n=2 Tax=Acanthoscelides obtectus TaxID=200917 RepID=A0A9P0JHL2_ACAOB|nr:unnamed protein product [Acanthoscelides obtectus]CAK1661454.1 hypothetical protein AOBTE_LOCUS22638 [Acanthoscelides obtectus]